MQRGPHSDDDAPLRELPPGTGGVPVKLLDHVAEIANILALALDLVRRPRATPPLSLYAAARTAQVRGYADKRSELVASAGGRFLRANPT